MRRRDRPPSIVARREVELQYQNCAILAIIRPARSFAVVAFAFEDRVLGFDLVVWSMEGRAKRRSAWLMPNQLGRMFYGAPDALRPAGVTTVMPSGSYRRKSRALSVSTFSIFHASIIATSRASCTFLPTTSYLVSSCRKTVWTASSSATTLQIGSIVSSYN